jgi:hypothetical protein
VGAANAASAGKAEGVGADSVAAAENGPWTDGAADGFGAATPLRTDVDDDDTGVVVELTVPGGCATLVVGVPLGPSF